MYSNAVGFSPSSVLSGLTKRQSQYGKGLSMQAGAALGLARDKENQQFGVKQMQDVSQQRLAAFRNDADRQRNMAAERARQEQMTSQRAIDDVGLRFDYAGLQKRRQLQLQQSLLNSIAREF